MNPLILYSTLGAVALGIVTGWSVRDWKADADQLQAIEMTNRQREKLQDKVDALSLGFEIDRSDADAKAIVRQTELRTIYRDVSTPTNCAAPDAAWRLLQDSVDEANARIADQSANAMSSTAKSPQPAQ